MRQKFWWMLGTAALLPAMARAQAVAQPQVITVTATRVPTPAADVAAGVTVLTAADFAARGDTTLAQALSTVPGLGVVQSGGPGTQTSVFIRGTNSEDVLVLLDGVPVNDPSEANGAFNFGDYTLADVQRIEVIRGPMSGLYGSNAIGGVINIITRRGEGKPKASLTLGGGWPAQGQGSATVSGSTGKFDYAVSGAIDEAAGFDNTARRLSVYAGHRDPYRAKLGSLNLGYTPVEGTRIYVVLRAEQVDAAFPDLGYPVFDDPNSFDYNTNLFGKFGVSSKLFDGRLQTDLFIARLQNTLHYSNLLDAADPNNLQANDRYHGDRTDVQWNNTLQLPDAGPARFSSATFGIEYANDSAHESVDEVSFGSPFIETVHASQHSLAGHVGAQTTLMHRLTLTAALRDDAVSSFGNALTGRIGGVLAIPEADARLKASFGTGFLAPSLFDLYGVDNYGYVGNPNLRPEYSSGFEAGPQFDLPGFGQPVFASLAVSYFQTSIRDLITTTPDFSSEENIGRANINGVESDLVVTPASWLSASLSYTYTRAEDATTRTELLRRPQDSGSATLTIGPVRGFTLVPQVQYIGRFVDYLYANDGYPTGNGSADPGTIVNLNANYRISDKFSLFATGKNILSSRFEPVNGLQIPGASLLLGVRATLE
jgi:vitamin B12 transporter